MSTEDVLVQAIPAHLDAIPAGVDALEPDSDTPDPSAVIAAAEATLIETATRFPAYQLRRLGERILAPSRQRRTRISSSPDLPARARW